VNNPLLFISIGIGILTVVLLAFLFLKGLKIRPPAARPYFDIGRADSDVEIRRFATDDIDRVIGDIKKQADKKKATD
jgi:hypothetical protein